MDAARRLSDDVHAASRHHGGGRRAAGHAAALRCQLDWLAVGRRRLCAQSRRVDPDCGRACRQVRASAGLHDRRRALHVFLAPLRPRLEHRVARCRPRATRDRRRRTLCNRTGSHRPRVPRPRALRSACRLGRDGGGCRCLGPADRRSPDRRPRVALDLLRQHSRSASSRSRLPSPVSRSPGTRARVIRT